MAAIDALTDPLRRTALPLLCWSGARRDEIRRLTCDSLDTHASGHPQTGDPVKGHTKRLIPLHPDAAALQEAINYAKTRRAAPRYDPTTGRIEDYAKAGSCPQPRFSMTPSTRPAQPPASLIPWGAGLSARTGSATPWAPSSPKEGRGCRPS